MSKILVLGISPLPIENEIMLSGPGIRTWQFVKPALEDENKVCLICMKAFSSGQGQNSGELIERGIDKNLTYHSVFQEKFRKISYIQKIHDDFKPDCIFSISSFLPSYAAVRIKTDKPIWFDRGDLMSEAQLKSAADSKGSYLYPFWKLEKSVLEKGDIFSSVSSPQKFVVIGRLGAAGRLNRHTLGYEFVNVIPCAAERGSYVHTNNVIRGKYVNDEDFVILWSGGYNTWADVDILFEALEMAMVKNKRIYYVSTGGAIPGQDETTYLRFLKMIEKSRHRDRYIMLGWVPTDKLPNIYIESNLAINIDKDCYEVILGSRHRLLDWMKAGLPILTTKPGEFTRMLDARKLVFTYTPDNSESLSRIIVKLSNDRKILAQYAKRAKLLVSKEFSCETTTRSFREWAKNPKYAPDKIINPKDKRYFKGLNRKMPLNIGREYAENMKLKLKIKRVAIECEKLKNHISNFENDRKNLGDHISSLETEQESLNNHIFNLENDRKNLRDHISNLENDRKNLRNHISNLENDRKNLRDHISSLETGQQETNKHVSNLENDRKNLRDHISSLETEQENQKQYISNLKIERDALAGRINKITSTSVYKIYNGIIKYIIAIKKWKGKIYRIRLDSASEPTSDNTKLNYEECKLLPLTLKSKPVLIYAEISTRCNLRCRMCGRAHYNISEADQGFMDRNIFKKLSALFTPNAQLALFGRGETLLHPDFIYFLKIARNAGMRVGFNTNGLLLTEKMAKAMVEYGQTHITFSCSAGTPQTYREIHGVDAWKKLWGNVKMLNDAKMKYGPARENHSTQDTLPVIYVEFVAQRSNIEELPALVSMAYNYALKGLMVIDVVAHSDKMEEERMNIPKNQPIAEEYYKKASLVCEDLIRKNGRDFDLRLPNSYSPITKKFSSEFEKSMLKGVGESADDAGSQSSGNGFCVEPWQTFYVRFDGTIAPCVITGRSLGDLHTAAADEIWNGSVYSKFRARMKGTSKPYECLRCHLFPGPKRYDTKLGDITQYELL